MNCRSCQYPLWNIRERKCPECGAPFAVSTYRFIPNTVQFKCPHCAQSYYGTDPDTGLLVPSHFICVRCAQPIGTDEMVLLPTAGVSEQRTADRHPWLQRDRALPFAWLTTVWRSISGPRRLIDATPHAPHPLIEWAFLLTTISLTALTSAGSIVLFALFVRYGVRGPGVTDIASITAWSLAVLGSLLLASLVWLLTIHAVLRLTGPTEPFARSRQALCYAAGPLVLASFPCLGLYLIPFAVVWWIVNTTVAIQRAHKVSTLRAVAASLALPLSLIALLFARLISLYLSHT